jgi:hypothetical protein
MNKMESWMTSVAPARTKVEHIRLHNRENNELLPEENNKMIITEMSALNKRIRAIQPDTCTENASACKLHPQPSWCVHECMPVRAKEKLVRAYESGCACTSYIFLKDMIYS